MTRPDTCPLADTTTIAWLYGEGPEHHVHHVAGCADCSAVAAEHADVMASVGPVLGALAERDVAARPEPADVPAVVADPEAVPVAANRPWLLVASLAVAAAAIVALVLWAAPVGTPDAPGVALVDDAVEAPIAVVEDAPSQPDEALDDELVEDLDEPVLDEPEQRVADLLAPEPTADTGLAADDGPDGDEPGTESPTRVAVLDLLDTDPADDAFSEGFDGLLDDFAALEADLATL